MIGLIIIGLALIWFIEQILIDNAEMHDELLEELK